MVILFKHTGLLARRAALPSQPLLGEMQNGNKWYFRACIMASGASQEVLFFVMSKSNLNLFLELSLKE
jgi:hypothetical protein